MKICVTAGGAGLDAPLDPRFGRCPFFVVVDLDSMADSSVQNTAAGAAGGTGIQAAQMVSQLGVSALVTGNVGPNALQVLSSAGIEIYQSQGGTVRDAIERFRRGELVKLSAPSVPPQGGMGRGRGMGGGRGKRW
ncbi:MAG: NifB/NifX family molybdenum-iron cluster-binding protein [Methanothrix sp.]|uniref:NifB/NifX family molybdenum-iron cluster-binding protein n=1 Tax=Methanothrix sp. TaxID=90426 RepID=UPI0025D7225D|nr:NifB/NifX family molybdenum-iron cluster-binding protein [Methanothrix sp.]MCQ8903005.1 NifB/NifX family molybdenum-iron cluster-binding protein [Methanothrix sp.]